MAAHRLGGERVTGNVHRHLRSRSFCAVGALLLLCLSACHEQKLKPGASGVGFKDGALEFGHVYNGAEASLTATLYNSSRGVVNVTWDELREPFFVDALPSKLDVGANTFTLSFRPTEWGERLATLTVRDGATVLARLSLRGVGQTIPTCPTAVACHQAVFDVSKGECVERPLDDGTSCDPQSVCVLNAACRAGRCVGEARSCDDQNACTQDLCNPLSGCESTPAPPCPSIGPCTVGVCDPAVGCTVQQADDGTVCGTVTCDAADVCISGACVNRDPPDGFTCAEATPCSGKGVCNGSACVKPAPTTLAAHFSFNAQTAGTPAPELQDLLLEPDGAMTLTGFYEAPRIRINSPLSRTMPNGVRRCILWNGRMACADHLATGGTGTLSLIDLATGAPVWDFALTAARPDFAAQVRPGAMFMARLAVLGPDRLMALFEAYPKGTTPDTQCRSYFLVLLNAGGQMVFASKLSDPLLEICDHPHPFGVAADAMGNIFLAFSTSAQGGAPLAATAPTTLFAFDRDGAIKWKRTENFVSGELALAKGLLFPERSSVAFNAQTGTPVTVGEGSRPFGRVVATADVVVPGPANALTHGASRLSAYSLHTGAAEWTYTLGAGESFVSPELRAVSFRSSPQSAAQDAALAFVSGAQGALSLHAVSLSSGRALWACPVEAPLAATPPQLFEVANGTFATMDSATTCGDCDPPFALSSGYFRSYALKGVTPATVPWPGTYGGAGHTHRETPVWSHSAAPR